MDGQQRRRALPQPFGNPTVLPYCGNETLTVALD